MPRNTLEFDSINLDLAEFPLIEVDLDNQSRKNISRLAQTFGVGQTVRIERKIIAIANTVVEDALQIARSLSPVRTGELRDSFYVKKADMSTINFSRIAMVIVPDSRHQNSWSWKKKPTNAGLADWLNTSTRHAGWIQAAQAEFDSLLESI